MELQDMTKKTKIAKSLKFELRPVGRTIETIREQNLLEADALLHEKSNAIRPLYDAYVKSMIQDILLKKGADITTTLLEKNEELKQAEDDKKKSIEKEMPVLVRKIFDKAAPIPIDSIKQGSFITQILPAFIKKDKGNMIPTDQHSLSEWAEMLKDVTSIYMEKYAVTRITSFDNAAKRVVENFFRYRDNTEKIQAFLTYAEGQTDLKEEGCVRGLSSTKYLDYYEMCLTESDIERYNRLVKGVVRENGIEQKGINHLINEANQKHRSDRSYNGPIFKLIEPLYQQILAPREKQYSRRKLDNDEELNAVMDTLKEMIGKTEMKNVITFLKDTDAEKLFLSGKDLHVISHIVFGDHAVIPDKMQEAYIAEQEKRLETAKNKKEEKEIQTNMEKAGERVREKFYSFAELTNFLKTEGEYKDIKSYVINHMTGLMFSADMYQKELPKQLSFYDKGSKQALITYFEPMNDFHRMTKLLKKKSDRQDDAVMEQLSDLTKNFRIISYTNNLVHGYMTRTVKEMSREEQICFGLASKLKTEWWNGEGPIGTKDGFLLKKDGKFYYATRTPGGKLKNKDVFAETEEEECYSIYLQKKAQAAYTNLPKITFKEIRTTEYFAKNPDMDFYILEKGMRNPVLIPKEAFLIKESGIFKTGNKNIEEKDRLEAMWKLIDVYKAVASNCIQFEKFQFTWKDTMDYKTIDQFFKDVDDSSVDARWRKVSARKIEEEIESGSLLVFLIWQRHLYKRGLTARNAYVKTFLSIFEEENMRTNEIRLNSNPTISFRPASIKKKITHPAGSMVVNRWTKDGKRIPESIHHEIYLCYNEKLPYDYLSDEAKRWYGRATAHKTKHDLVKYGRYTEDKFFLSISYIKNAKAEKEYYALSTEVREGMKNGFYTMSIVRGFQDLLYYQVFDPEQKVAEEGSLNVLFGVDYAEYLSMLSEECKRAKMEKWEYDKKVKSIKDAYLNAAIAKVLRIAFQYKATIVIEKIDEKFKKKWSCIDNQFFSVFEKRLENKLKDYFTADVPLGEPGSVTNPVQAAGNARSDAMQNGLLFRLNGSYTSNIDPYTGFVNLFSFSQYNGTKSRREFLGKFEHIIYENGSFYFCFDYQNFGNIKCHIKKTRWTIKAGGRRTKYHRSFKYNYIEQDIAKEAKTAMEKADVKGNLVNEISNCPAYLVNALFNLLKTAATDTIMKKCEGNEEEYLVSPILGDIQKEKRVKPIQRQGKMLAEKLWFYLGYKGKEYTQDWINHIQEKAA